MLSGEQMSKRWLCSLLNDEQMSNWVGVEHLPVNQLKREVRNVFFYFVFLIDDQNSIVFNMHRFRSRFFGRAEMWSSNNPLERQRYRLSNEKNIGWLFDIAQMLHVWIIYLYTLGEKWPHSKGNVGKYSLHGASG